MKISRSVVRDIVCIGIIVAGIVAIFIANDTVPVKAFQNPGPVFQTTSTGYSGKTCGSNIAYLLGPAGRFLTCQGGTLKDLAATGATGATGPSQRSCQPGLGDGSNSISSGTYLTTTCYNDTGSTVTITAIKCFTDNSGSSTLNATNSSGTALLTGAVTCTGSFASGTQSATTTLASGDYIKFTFVADGTSKQTTWTVAETF